MDRQNKYVRWSPATTKQTAKCFMLLRVYTSTLSNSHYERRLSATDQLWSLEERGVERERERERGKNKCCRVTAGAEFDDV
jgi:hypothetical protein